ncbi:hypothetical protein [Alkalihalobacillus sp. LMS39]|uniref:hypothetical protein n=1 Tax=Alkalihalobacillus sp. LMS39 TaxID=2924032 RepID=UPI001FB4C925|nr:hypothetical protein [Alkalihalobacillus sp. LMS39]UOE92271.1 hypothetical protein MM271_13485 [Alkalihalobacillus sp. LMS39]
MWKDLFDMSWMEKFLPDRMRTVRDDILSDQATLDLLQETERILGKLIEQTSKYQQNRTLQKKTINYKIIIKIRKKRIKLQIQDTYQSRSPIKKRIYIDCYRKHFKAVNGIGKVKDSTIHYIENRKSYVRNVRKSPYLQPIFYKIDMLDDALLGRLIDDTKTPPTLPSTSATDEINNKTQSPQKNEEMKILLHDTKRLLQHKNSFSLDPLLENRLERIIKQTDKLVPHFELLDIEDRHTVKRMFREDIPNLIYTFLSLSKENQLEQKENVFVALSKMELNIIRLTEELERNRVERMNHLLKLNDARYSDK